MRSQRTALVLLAVAIGIVLGGGPAVAEITTDRSGSILVFPKVIANGTRDTIIQITNVSNSLVRAHCFYVNAALEDPELPESSENSRLWQEVDFDITLTKQQPTHWTVSRGRGVNPFDPSCTRRGTCEGGSNDGGDCADDAGCPDGACSNTRCDDAGFDPGLIPPVVPDFEGELKCVQVDDSGSPLSGNQLKGEATLVSIAPDAFAFLDDVLFQLASERSGDLVVQGEVSKYNAIAVVGDQNNGDGTLVLGGGQCVGAGGANGQVCQSDGECGDAGPCIAEYNACPRTWILDHAADGAPNIVLEAVPVEGGMSSIETELTIVPCTQNFETQEPTSVTLQFETIDEFESRFSTSTSITCWGNFRLGDIGAPALTFAGTLVPDPQGTMYMQTRMRTASGTPFGVFMVAEEFHAAKAFGEGAGGLSAGSAGGTLPAGPLRFVSTAAVNLHVAGERPNPDRITIPAEQLAP